MGFHPEAIVCVSAAAMLVACSADVVPNTDMAQSVDSAPSESAMPRPDGPQPAGFGGVDRDVAPGMPMSMPTPMPGSDGGSGPPDAPVPGMEPAPAEGPAQPMPTNNAGNDAGNDDGAAAPGGGTSGCGQAGMTGTFQSQVMVEGVERGFYVSVPETYDPAVPNRLLFGYHGSGWNGRMMRGYLQLEEGELARGSLFVYPDGLPRNGVTEWNLDADGPDMAFFDAILARMAETYCVDETRVFVNGQSFGGLMTNAVGCARGDVVRAIAVVAGSGPWRGACVGQVAAWLTHGEDDDAVGFSGGEASRDHWAEANHCDATTSPGMPEQCQRYDGCDPDYPVIWCPHIADGGHQHPSFGRQAVRDFFLGF